MRVLYEDNHLIAVWKDAGLLTQSAVSGDDNLLERVREYLKVTYAKPGNVFVGLLHRLDRNVSGIVLFAKTSKGAARLSEQIRAGKMKKIYHATVVGRMPEKGVLTHHMKKDEGRRVAEVFDTAKPGTKDARLTFETVTSTSETSVVRVHLQTGRFHQIRAQFAHIGHPLLGDVKYGGPKSKDGMIALTATGLSFETATGGKKIELTERA